MTAVLLATLVIAAYLGFVWAPVYVLHYAVKGVVRDYANQAVKNRDDAGLREKMAHKVRSLQEETVVLEDGSTTRIPVIDLAAEDILWERDEEEGTATLHVAFSYVRTVHYPLLGRDADKIMELDMVRDISRPDWGPSQ